MPAVTCARAQDQPVAGSAWLSQLTDEAARLRPGLGGRCQPPIWYSSQMRWVPSGSTARPPSPVMPASWPVPLDGTIAKYSAVLSLPEVDAEWTKLNVPV